MLALHLIIITFRLVRIWNDNFHCFSLWHSCFVAGAESWYNEYRRLTNNIPMVLTDDIKDAHGHQVLHVSFSHNGKMFATCSKDGFVIVSYHAYLFILLLFAYMCEISAPFPYFHSINWGVLSSSKCTYWYIWLMIDGCLLLAVDVQLIIHRNRFEYGHSRMNMKYVFSSTSCLL